jgi:hypothetical protein
MDGALREADSDGFGGAVGLVIYGQVQRAATATEDGTGITGIGD